METECDVRPKATRLTAPPSVLQTSVIQRKLIHFSLPASYHRCDSSACWVADTNARITQPRPSSLSGRPKSNSQARYQTEQPGAVIPIVGRSSIKGQKDSPKAPGGSYTKTPEQRWPKLAINRWGSGSRIPAYADQQEWTSIFGRLPPEPAGNPHTDTQAHRHLRH